MPVFTDPDKFKKHAQYVILLKKALKLVKADPPRSFLYFKVYPFDKDKPLLLVDSSQECQKAVIASGLKPTAKGKVKLTANAELDFTPKEGKLNRFKLQRYFDTMGGGINAVYIPAGEVDEDEGGVSAEGAVTSQAKPTPTVMPELPSIPSTSASASKKAMDKKMEFEETAFKLNQHIAALEKQVFPPDQQEQAQKALMMAKSLVASGKHADAIKLLTMLAAKAKAAQTDSAKPEEVSAPKGGKSPMDKKMEFEETAFKLNQHIAALEKQVFPPDQQEQAQKALMMAKSLVVSGKHADAIKLLTMLATKAKAANAPSGAPQGSDQAAPPTGADPAKAAIQKSLDALDAGYRQALKAVNYSTDALRDAHDRVEAALKQDKIPEAQKALSDLRFELKRLSSQGAKTVRLAAANKNLKKGLSEANDKMKPQPGATAAIEKQKLSPGKEFKSFLSSLKAVEKDGSQQNLLSLQQAAQGYIDHFEAKHAGHKSADDKNNKEKLKLSKEWLGKAKAMLALMKSEAILKANPGDEQAIEKAQGEYGQAMIHAGLGALNDSGGASDSYKIKDATGKNAFVFKPQKGEETLPGMPAGAGMAREAIQSKIGDEMRNILGLDVAVARTSIVTTSNDMFAQGRNSDPDQVGALQEFLDSDGDAKSKLSKGDRKWIDQVDQKSLESMAVLDIIMLNGDRKGDNMLIKEQPDGTTKLMPIDAGAGLPSKDTFEKTAFGGFFSPVFGESSDGFGNMYNLIPAASQPFSQETLDAIARLDPKEMRDKLAGHKQQMEDEFPSTKGTIDDSTLDLSQLSMRVLKKAAPQCSILEINYIMATKVAALANNLPAATDNQIDTAIADAKRIYVFVDEVQRKQLESAKLGQEINSLRDDFKKAHLEGEPDRDKFELLYKESNDLNSKTFNILKYWERITDDTPIKTVFDPLLAKRTECLRILKAG